MGLLDQFNKELKMVMHRSFEKNGNASSEWTGQLQYAHMDYLCLTFHLREYCISLSGSLCAYIIANFLLA